jgi:hypothetical protein
MIDMGSSPSEPPATSSPSSSDVPPLDLTPSDFCYAAVYSGDTLGYNKTHRGGDADLAEGVSSSDWGDRLYVGSQCQGHVVYPMEHDTNFDRNQITYPFHKHGNHHLHALNGEITAMVIKKIPLDDSSKMVGFNRAWYLCAHNKSSVNRIFKDNIWFGTSSSNQYQAEACPGGTIIPRSCGKMRDYYNNVGYGDEYGGSGNEYACVYSKTEGKLQEVYNALSSDSNRSPMVTDMINRLCVKEENLAFSLPTGGVCAEHEQGREIAKQFCSDGENILTETEICSADVLTGGQSTYDEILKDYCGRDANIKTQGCAPLNTGDGASGTFETLARAYCDTATGKSDSWCSCYNVKKHATDGSFCNSNSTATGCQTMKDTFGVLVEKTPSDQKALWSGMEACFGGVCGTGNIFKPTGYNDNCDRPVNVCIQDFTIESLVDTNFQAACVIDSGGDGPSVDDQGQTGNNAAEQAIAKDNLNKAEQELADAEAAVAAGEPGAEERLAAAKKALGEAEADVLEPPSLTDFQNNPQAYFPQSIEGLKTDQRQQIGAGVIGAVALAFMMMMLLLVAGSGGGSGAPVRRRRYR